MKGVPMTPEIAKAVSWNAETRSARFVMSAEVTDRMGDVVVQEGLDTTNFTANPQALLFHNSRSWPIGKWVDVEKNLTGRPKRTEGTMMLLAKGDDADSDRAAVHLAAGTMRTVSIGFRPDWDAVEAIRDDEGHFTGYRFLQAELYECSLVPVPALPAATMKAIAPGMLSKEALELIEMTLDTFALDPRTGLVISRDTLEAQYRQTTGDRTAIVISDAQIETIVRGVREGLVAAEAQRGAAKPAKPTEEEQGVEKPDPASDEKQKTIAVVREHARQSAEPGLWSKLLGALMPKENIPVAWRDPVVEDAAPPEPISLSVEDKAAIDERVQNRIRATERRVTEPA
ncbi:HK97 family phage prohead protease [Aurantimonas sp. CSK15Z-1]|nr:HK97 family phage prohead protease [Aurantimonas sp. CSK15Z-1]